MIKSFIWFTGYGYTFDIGHQISGIEEDELNCDNIPTKKRRPLVSGAMTVQGAFKRLIVSNILYIAGSWKMGGLPLTLQTMFWVVMSTIYNFHNSLDKLFVTKNYYTMTAGVIAMLFGARALAGEVVSSVVPALLVSIWVGLCMDVQDFCDEEGDKLSGRLTTTIILGVEKARKVWAAQIFALTPLMAFFVRKGLSLWSDGLIGLRGLALVYHTLGNKTPHKDDKSYKNFILLAMMVLFRSAFWAKLH